MPANQKITTIPGATGNTPFSGVALRAITLRSCLPLPIPLLFLSRFPTCSASFHASFPDGFYAGFSKQEAQSFHNNASSSLDRETQLPQDAHKKGSAYKGSIFFSYLGRISTEQRAHHAATRFRMRTPEPFNLPIPSNGGLILETSSRSKHAAFDGFRLLGCVLQFVFLLAFIFRSS